MTHQRIEESKYKSFAETLAAEVLVSHASGLDNTAGKVEMVQTASLLYQPTILGLSRELALARRIEGNSVSGAQVVKNLVPKSWVHVARIIYHYGDLAVTRKIGIPTLRRRAWIRNTIIISAAAVLFFAPLLVAMNALIYVPLLFLFLFIAFGLEILTPRIMEFYFHNILIFAHIITNPKLFDSRSGEYYSITINGITIK